MDEFRKNTEQDASEQTTPFQTPVRGADEQPGAGYQNAGASYTHTNSTADSSNFTDAGNGGSTPPPHSNAYEQWSGGKKPGGPKGPKGPKKKFPWKPVAAVVIVGALAFGGGWAANGHISLPTLNSSSDSSTDTGSGTSSNTTKVQLSSTSEDMASYSEVYQKVSPSIVAIVVDSVQQGTESSGSGVIMSEDGYIITNNHVVEGGDMYKVVLSNGKSYTAKLVGTDEQTDLAVLKIDATGLTAAEFGDSDNLKVGDRAFAIGSPGGLEYQNSFTGGFISAINRNVTINDRVMTLIQTDTAINPGNSGGALINSAGQVIGITNSKLSASSSDSASIEGMGFAIPMTTVKEVVDELIANGHVTGRPAIGISGYDIDSTRASYFNLPQGVYVSSVDPSSDAYQQGIQAGDIITGVNGKDITSMTDINEVKNELKVGDTMKLTIYRDGSTKEVSIKLIDQSTLSGTASSSGSDSSSSEDNSGGQSGSQNGGSTNPYGSYGYGYTIP